MMISPSQVGYKNISVPCFCTKVAVEKKKNLNDKKPTGNKIIVIMNTVNFVQYGESGINTVSWWLAIPAAQLITVKSFIHQQRLRQSAAQRTNKFFLCSL